MDTIPVIDFGLIGTSDKKTSDTEEQWKILSENVFNALSRIGFMYIIKHGIPQSKIDHAFAESEGFFQQPDVIKEKYLIDMSKNYRGYTRPGQQILSHTSFHEFRECFSIEEPDEAYTVEETPGLISSIEDLRKHCRLPVRQLLRLIAMALKLDDEDYFVNNYNGGRLHQDPGLNSSMVRTHYYPPIPEEIQIPANSVRCSEHTDFGILTFLFQDAMGGLEVKALAGNWIKANPIRGAILVNTGDIMELWTGGLFPATPHRVLIPEEEIQKRTKRQSITYFVNPDSETLVSPLSSKLCHGSGRSFESVIFRDHYQKRLEASYKY
ncbi:unnamed protein product [Allacma fusca]|uniref:Fe2OG dioxygenase domain-containing protein n=1 Tax=Allacma fusca TaxID=39272 RepID=A0A8J2NYC4_9HEXA|nr:unnamed protein product [Allacma fusca]